MIFKVHAENGERVKLSVKLSRTLSTYTDNFTRSSTFHDLSNITYT